MRHTRRAARKLTNLMSMCRYTGSVLGRLWGYGNGLTPIQCINCGVRSRFWAFGFPPRYIAQCPSCGTLERHRLFVLLDEREHLFQNKSVLHFAPESVLQERIKRQASTYLSADIDAGRADIEMNIESIKQPNESWDIVVALHVLEHVNDELAIRETYRILKPGGKCIFMTPMIEGWSATYENPSVTAPRDRISHFGQGDHLRYYGRDLKQKLERSGLSVGEFSASGSECVQYGLVRGARRS